MTNNIFTGINNRLMTKFKKYHEENPHIFAEFKKYAFQMKQAQPKSSAWLIVNRIRWDHEIRTTGKPFKISNDFIGLYARLLVHHYPQFKGFFTLKKMKGQS